MEMKPSFRPDARYFLPVGFCLLFLFTTRFLDLSAKPYHHDESLYAVESWRYATQGIYRFNPMFHGPLLFHLQAAFFKILPINDFTGRLPVVLAGIGLALLAFPLAARIGWLSASVWLALVSFSPVFTFFSRFLGMDVLMTFLAAGLLICGYELWQRRTPGWLYGTALFFISLVCIKLNWLFYLFSFGTFFLALPLFSDSSWKTSLREGKREVMEFLTPFRLHWAGVAALCIAVFCLLNSSFFTNPGGILDALYRKMIPYWIHQHQIERVGGPFHYYFPLLAVYELPLLAGILFSTVAALRSSKSRRKSALSWLFGALLLYVAVRVGWNWISPAMIRVLHFKEPFHPSLLVLEIGLWLLLMKHHLKEDEPWAAFSAHWGVTSLILYSMAGEKVPWLATHVLLPWFFYFALVIPPMAMKWMLRPVTRTTLGIGIIVVVAWQGVITVRSSFTLASDPHEMLVYTHTTEETVDLARRIRRLSETGGEGAEFPVQVTGNGVWPIHWYLRDFKRWYWPTISPGAKPKVVVNDWEKKDETAALLGPGYEVERYPLRAWWVPAPEKAGIADYLTYYFRRKIFNPTGSSDLSVFLRHDVLDEWRRSPLAQ